MLQSELNHHRNKEQLLEKTWKIKDEKAQKLYDENELLKEEIKKLTLNEAKERESKVQSLNMKNRKIDSQKKELENLK